MTRTLMRGATMAGLVSFAAITLLSSSASAGLGNIFGVVKDESTGKPIETAQVCVNVHTDTICRSSHPDGVYTVIVPDGDNYKVTVTHPDYSPTEFVWTPVPPGTLYKKDFYLTRTKGLDCGGVFAECDGNKSTKCETNLWYDPNNCGACGQKCGPYANADSACTYGVCGMGSCAAGFGNCDGDESNGCEAHFSTDKKNCSACGKVCSYPNAQAVCTDGTCELWSCNTGSADCDKNSSNGCEVIIKGTPGDVNNCGACGKVCALPNATPKCTSGVCYVASCDTGWAICDGNNITGCETNIATDVNNCGKCGKVCGPYANAIPACTNGSCGISSCAAGYSDCDGNASNGCEVNLQTDANNCGACGKVCVSSACANGECWTAGCAAGYGDCDKDQGNGCETNILGTDVNNCGACGKVCGPYANATAACANGTCEIAGCVARGYADCDKSTSNACEVNLYTDVNNCGACGKVCGPYANATAACTNGTCEIASCNTGFGDCDGNVTNGCEANVATDANNCGACGTVCSFSNATPACTNGTCKIASCKTGYMDCDGNASNGCEANVLGTDVNNCGACGKVCASYANAPNPFCRDGTCFMGQCTPYYSDCDQILSNGCEVYTETDNNNCGACFRKCAAGTTCIGSLCK